MVRIILGIVAGFLAWMIVWIGIEKILSAVWPAFGAHQKTFEEVIKNGGQFTADTTMLLTHIVLGSIVSVMAGSLASVIAGENSRAPLFVGILLLATGVMKAVMSWPYVPIWYHIIFTAMLLPLAVLGGRLIIST
jgi:hypothetical protein